MSAQPEQPLYDKLGNPVDRSGKPAMKTRRGAFVPAIPEIAQAYQNDPRATLAKQLMSNAMAGPTRGVRGTKNNIIDGIARTLQAVAGQYIQRQTEKKYDERQNAVFDAIKKASGAGGIPETPKEPLSPPPVLNGGATPPGDPLGGVGSPATPLDAGSMGGAAPASLPLNGGPPPLVPTAPNQPAGPPPSAAPVLSGQPQLAGGPGAPAPPSPADQMAPGPEVMAPGRPARPNVDPAANSQAYKVAQALLQSDDPAVYGLAMEYMKSGVDANDRNMSDVAGRKFGLDERTYAADLNDYTGARSDARSAQYQKENQARAFKHDDDQQARQFKHSWAMQASSQGFQAGENSKQRAWDAEKIRRSGGWDSGGKALKPAYVKKFEDFGSKLSSMRDLATTFKRGNVGYTGGAWGRARMAADSVAANALGGALSGAVDQNRLAWWKEWDLMDNEVRHGTFGATLTKYEKASWEGTTVTPGTPPAVAAKNIKKRYEIMARAALRSANGAMAEGYNGRAIGEYLGQDNVTAFDQPLSNPELYDQPAPRKGDKDTGGKPLRVQKFGNREAVLKDGKWYWQDSK